MPELEPRRRAELLDEVERTCTSRTRWEGYSHRVSLEYCMWKHLTMGVCANSVRMYCDSDCCPVAQNFLSTGSGPTRPDQYVCRKEPTVGLFCQHVDYLAPANSTPAPAASAGGRWRELCTEATCPTFGWCRDLADIPGQCLGRACEDYERSRAVALVLAATAALGVACDLLDLVLLCQWPSAARPKAAANASAAFLKLGGCLLLLACGVQGFADAAVAAACFNDEGNRMVAGLRGATGGFLVAAIIAAAGSLTLAPLSAHWGGHLAGVPIHAHAIE